MKWSLHHNFHASNSSTHEHEGDYKHSWVPRSFGERKSLDLDLVRDKPVVASGQSQTGLAFSPSTANGERQSPLKDQLSF